MASPVHYNAKTDKQTDRHTLSVDAAQCLQTQCCQGVNEVPVIQQVDGVEWITFRFTAHTRRKVSEHSANNDDDDSSLPPK